MTRTISLILFVGLASAGCASRHQAQAPAPRVYRDAPAMALAFTPPAALDQPTLELARDLRQPSAFLGYYDVTSTVFYLRTDDRIGQDGYQWLIRRAVSERTGVSYR